MNKFKDVKDLIEILDERYDDWRTIDIQTTDLDRQPFGNLVYDLCFIIKRIIITDNLTLQDIKKSSGVKRKFPQFIETFIENSMKYYNYFERFRKFSEENPKAGEYRLDDIFEEYILHYDPLLIYDHVFIDDSGKEFIDFNVLDTIKSLTDYYLIKNYTKKQISKDFRNETGMPYNICEHYAKIVYKNRMELKQNLILKILYSNIQKK